MFLLKCVAGLIVVLAAQRAFADPSAQEIFEKSRAMYAALTSYSDMGTVLKEAPGINDKHAFLSRYQAPRSFYLDFKKANDADRFVIWSDASSFYTWWKTTGVQDEFPKGQGAGAFSQADYLTAGSAMMIPTLLFSQSGLVGPLTNYKDEELDGTEDVGGHQCYKLVGTTRDIYTGTGKEVNIRRMTVWIDKDTLFIRKIFQDTPKGTPINLFSHTTTTFEPQTNPSFNADSFRFDAPAAN